MRPVLSEVAHPILLKIHLLLILQLQTMLGLLPRPGNSGYHVSGMRQLSACSSVSYLHMAMWLPQPRR